MSKPVFLESQRFNQPWVWILIGSVVMLSLGIIVSEYIQTAAQERKDELIIALTLAVCLMGLVLALIVNLRLETRIDNQGIHYKFRPFVRNWKLIPVSDIRSAEVIKYNPLLYGGWGYRLGLFGHGRAINIRGNRGISIIRMNGKKLMIGTQKPEEAAKAIVNMFRKDR
jgi:hypothetical protein